MQKRKGSVPKREKKKKKIDSNRRDLRRSVKRTLRKNQIFKKNSNKQRRPKKKGLANIRKKDTRKISYLETNKKKKNIFRGDNGKKTYQKRTAKS